MKIAVGGSGAKSLQAWYGNVQCPAPLGERLTTRWFKGGEWQLLNSYYYSLLLRAAGRPSSCCLFRENEFSTQVARPRSRLALAAIKSGDWT